MQCQKSQVCLFVCFIFRFKVRTSLSIIFRRNDTFNFVKVYYSSRRILKVFDSGLISKDRLPAYQNQFYKKKKNQTEFRKALNSFCQYGVDDLHPTKNFLL